MPATSVASYLAGLPEDRRDAVETVRRVVNEYLPRGYEEGIQYGMIGWYVPKSRYPAGYHVNPKEPLPFAHLAAQKSYYALYLMFLIGDSELSRAFAADYAKAGKKLDMGKACVRFKRLDDLPLEVVGRTIAKMPVDKWISVYETQREAGAGRSAKTAAKKTAAKKTAAKKTAAKKTAAKKTAAKKTAPR